MNALFVRDPDGDEILTSLAQAINRNADAIQSASDQADREHSIAEAERRKEAAALEARDKERASKDAIQDALDLMLHRGAYEKPAPAPESRSVPPAAPANSDPTLAENPVDDEDGPWDEDEPFDPDDVPDHIDDVRLARAEQRRQAETGSYGPEPFTVTENADGRTLVKPMLKPTSLSDLALLNKLERLRRDRQAAKLRSNGSTAQDRTDRVATLFTRSRTEPVSNSANGGGTKPEPQAQDTFWGRMKRHFSTPAKGVWT